MPICIEIEVADDGKVSVGVCPPGEESGEPKSYMQPAESIDAALQTAKGMLSGGQAPQGQPAQPMAQSAPEQDPNAAAAARFNEIRGGM